MRNISTVGVLSRAHKLAIMLLILILSSTNFYGQYTLAKWYGADYTPTVFYSQVQSGQIKANNVTVNEVFENPDSNFYKTQGWPTPQWNQTPEQTFDESKYVEFKISAKAGYKINVDSFNFEGRANGADGQKLKVRYSNESDFSNAQDLLTDEATSGTFKNYNLRFPVNTVVNQNENLYVRLYIYNTNQFFYIRHNQSGTIGPEFKGTISYQNILKPSAQDDRTGTVKNVAVNVDVLANDDYFFSGPLTAITVLGAPKNGTARANGTSDIIYTPNTGFTGYDSFTYTLTNSEGVSNIAKVSVQVVEPGVGTATPIVRWNKTDLSSKNYTAAVQGNKILLSGSNASLNSESDDSNGLRFNYNGTHTNPREFNGSYNSSKYFQLSLSATDTQSIAHFNAFVMKYRSTGNGNITVKYSKNSDFSGKVGTLIDNETYSGNWTDKKAYFPSGSVLFPGESLYIRVYVYNTDQSTFLIKFEENGEVGPAILGTVAKMAPESCTVSSASGSPTVCVNSAITPITHTTSGATGVGTATGLPAGVTAVWKDNKITISGTPTESGTFNYSIPLLSACSGVQATGPITVVPATVAGTVTSNIPEICVGPNAAFKFAILKLNGNVGNVLRWEYSLDNFATPSVIAVNSTADEITVEHTEIQSYYYRAVVQNRSCAVEYSNVVRIDAVGAVNLPGSIAGNDSLCAGQTAVYSIASVPNATSYQWFVDIAKGWEIISGQGTTTVTVKAGNGSGNIAVDALNSCSTGFAYDGEGHKYITVKEILQPSVLISSPITTICQGTKVTFTATSVNGGSAPAYQWFVNGVAVAGQTAATFETKELKNGDKVSVTLASSIQQCVLPEPVVSNIITMSEETSVYENGQWSNGIPTAKNQLSAEIREAYSTSKGSVTACSVHLVGSAIVTVVPKNPLIVYNNINLDNGTKLNVESDANLIQVNDSAPANTGNITVLRDLKIKPKSAEYNYFGSPVTFAPGHSMKTIYPGITYVLYHNEANNYFYNSSGANIPGRGLAVKEPSITTDTPNGAYDITATFIGVPQNGIINFALANSNTATSSHLGYNLVGNPYPSNIDLQALYELNKGQIAADPAISTSFYFWDSTANNVYVQQGSSYGGQAYGVFNAKSGTTGMGIPAAGPKEGLTARKIPKSEITVGQGFMVKALKKNATLQFNNSIRTDKNSGVKFIGARGEEVVDDRYWLSVTTPGNLTSTLAVVYFDGGTDAVGAEDSEARGGSDEVFSLVSGKNIAINGKSTFADTDVVAIGTRHFAAGLHTIALEKAEGIFASGQQIYLKDKLTGAVTNLSQGNYTFDAQAGESTGRFEIVYKPSGVLASDTTIKEEVQVYRAADDFVVKAPKRMTAIDVYDMSGRLLRTAKPNTTEYTLNGSELTNGVYLMKIRQGSEQTVKKIIK